METDNDKCKLGLPLPLILSLVCIWVGIYILAFVIHRTDQDLQKTKQRLEQLENQK